MGFATFGLSLSRRLLIALVGGLVLAVPLGLAGRKLRLQEYMQAVRNPLIMAPREHCELIDAYLVRMKALGAYLEPQSPCPDPVIDETALIYWGKAYEEKNSLPKVLRDLLDGPTAKYAVYDFFSKIEDRLPGWRDLVASQPSVELPSVPLRTPMGTINVKPSIDERGNLTLDFGKELGAGGFKRVYEVLTYKTWDRVAQYQFIAKGELIGDTPAAELEARNLHLIRSLPLASRTGLMETVSFSRGGRINALLYDTALHRAALLSRFNPRSDRFDLELLESIFSQLGEGLVTLHEQLNLVHADIKPANILLLLDRRDPTKIRAVLGDLGIAQNADWIAQQGRYATGTLLFMPAEALLPFSTPSMSERARIAKKRDVYALTATLAQLLLPSLAPKLELYRQAARNRDTEDLQLDPPLAANAQRQSNARRAVALRGAMQQELLPGSALAKFIERGLAQDANLRPDAGEWLAGFKTLMRNLKSVAPE